MSMKITKNNIETLIAILTLLAEKECKLDDARDVLSKASSIIQEKAIVPPLDYKKEYNFLFEHLEK